MLVSKTNSVLLRYFKEHKNIDSNKNSQFQTRSTRELSNADEAGMETVDVCAEGIRQGLEKMKAMGETSHRRRAMLKCE